MREAGHPVRSARENLDLFRALSGPLYQSDEGPAPGPAAAVQHLHHFQSENTEKSFTFN